MKRELLLTIFLITFYLSHCQNCNCDITLNGLSSTSLNIIWASQTSYSPGNTICIPSGTYRGIRFYDFEGTEAAPLTIINCGGKVIIDESHYSGIDFQRSKFIHLTGTGDSIYQYGFDVVDTGGGSVGVNLQNLSTDIEVDHIEVSHAGFAGIMAKTDPQCSRPETWRRNGFIMKNLNIHDNYVHNTGGEGLYIGFTGGYKLNSNRSCSGDPIYGHWLENVDVYNNIFEDIDWDAIQLNLVRANGIIRNNTVKDYGTDGRWGQSFALSLGGGIYSVHNNYLENNNLGKGWGMQLISGQSGTKIFNNVFVGPKKHGIFLHQRHDFDDLMKGYYIVNNTIIEPEHAGIHYNSKIIHPINPQDKYRKQDEVPNFFVNNLIVNPGYDFEGGNTWKQNQESYVDFNDKSTRDSMAINIYTNLLTRDMDTLGLVDVTNNNFSPATLNSNLVNSGTDISSWGITFDISTQPRPSGHSHDIGAFEFQQTSGNFLSAVLPNLIDNSPSETSLFYPNPVKTSFQIINKKQEKVQLEIISLQGRIIYQNEYTMGNNLNVEELSSGLYIIRLKAQNFQELHKIIIQ
ncbi:T9SS type A sorting domain-containing protein [Croceitalea vernalis]|uniref:T9SS type A sorting domain-containing protein n=1 Tax=Croceitalea vernalis TaxID=3075599 RepID=A0ABU3BFH4_9FLAO|nr:T9SS type A sorting domain-containing protein [Croceitalea sp. P007]MDT0620915.1 T9SS type A sorting domain-containing protein [Croceitalea sp. P007]